MTYIQKYWLFILAVFGAGDFVTNIFTNLFLWQTSNSLMTIALYDLFIFIAIPIAALISCYVAQIKGVKYVYYAAIVFYLIQLIIILVLKQEVVNYIYQFGFISGLSIGFQSYAYNLITEEVTKEKREEFFGYHGSLQQVLGLTLPIIYSIIISKLGGFNFVFGLALIFFTFLSIIFLFFPFSRQHTKFLLKSAIQIPGTNPDKIKLFWLKFLAGLQSGITWSLTGVILLSLLKGIVKWGILTSLFTLISIAGCYFYGKNVNIKQSRFFFALTALIYAFACIVLAVNFTISSYIVFLIANTLLGIVMSVNFDAIIDYLIEKDINIEDLKEEYQAILEIPLAMGRILPIVFILIMGINNANSSYLAVIFLVLAPLPLYMINTFVKTQYSKEMDGSI